MMRGTRALLALVIVMGVLIVLGTTTLVVVVVHRLTHPEPAGETGPPPPASRLAVQNPLPAVAVLSDEPPGTRITALARQSDTRLAIALAGGGPDRVLIWDLAAGRAVTEIRLGR